MTTPNAFGAAGSVIDQQKKAVLDAIAQGGTAARQAYEAQQAQLAAQKKAAVDAALAQSALRGAPVALQQQMAGDIAAPYDRQVSTMGQASASRQADIAQRGAGSQSYLAEVKGAIPIVQSTAERELQRLRSQAAEQAAQRAHEAQMRAMELQLAQKRLEAADRENSPDSWTPGKIIGALGGAEVASHLIGQGSEAIRHERAITSAGSNGRAGGERAQVGYAPPEGVRLDAVGQSLGLPSGFAASLLKSQEKPAPKQTDDDLRRSGQYAEASRRFLGAYQRMTNPKLEKDDKPGSVSEILDQLVATYGPEVAGLIWRDFGGAAKAEM